MRVRAQVSWHRETERPRRAAFARAAACAGALVLGCACAYVVLQERRTGAAGLLTLSEGEDWYNQNKDYGTDGTEAGVQMEDWYPRHKNVSDVERTWYRAHEHFSDTEGSWYSDHAAFGNAAAEQWYRQHTPQRSVAAAASRLQKLYGAAGHWGGVGSEGYGTKDWDNSGWNSHYHPRDGASMDSESMEPWYWRKGPRVNDEYTGHMADGDPLFSPPSGWEPPINYHDSSYLPEANGGGSNPLLERMSGMKTNPYA